MNIIKRKVIGISASAKAPWLPGSWREPLRGKEMFSSQRIHRLLNCVGCGTLLPTEHPGCSLASFQRLKMHLKCSLITQVSCDTTKRLRGRVHSHVWEKPFISIFRICTVFSLLICSWKVIETTQLSVSVSSDYAKDRQRTFLPSLSG